MDNLNNKKNIRNFCIVAHIDHGKSTLADRLLEYTNTVDKRSLSTQTLDNMELEQERGITIKLSPVRMKYNYKGEEYVLNLIDTPGHVDFTYEVSRSLAACDGAIVLVDSTQGIEAQTISNIYLAIENNLEILPVVNKIDLPSANIPEVKKQIKEFLGFNEDEIPAVSAKMGTNISAVLDAVCEHFPSPKGLDENPLQALIFDSYYDNFKGAVCLIGVKNGTVKAGQKIRMMSTGAEFETTEVGIFKPNPEPCEQLKAGDIGYICASIKQVKFAKVGDTITTVEKPAKEPLAGYKEVMPVVFAGIYPVDGDKFNDLKDALEKLKLSDSSLAFVQESSQALGFGFRCGFLGLLHMEIVTERLEREFNLDLITTAPSVSYNVEKMNGDVVEIANPTLLPSPTEIKCIHEPMVNLNVYTPPEYVGQIMDLANEKRGEYKDMVYQDAKRVKLSYKMPLNEIVFDFFDKLKSRSKGYASLDYELAGYQIGELVKVDVLLNQEKCDALSLITHKEKAYQRGSALALKLKDAIPRQMFEIPIQAAIGGKIIARETVKAMRKDVLAKCYGGDISRKRKLLEKQKEGKKKMRRLGSVELPSEAFISILKID